MKRASLGTASESSLVNAALILLRTHGVMCWRNNTGFVLPYVPETHLPSWFHHSPLAQLPMVHEFDGMTLTSGTVVF